MKKILLSFLFILVLLTGVSKFALAEGANVNLIVKNNGEIIYSGSITLLPAGTISLNDSSGNPHNTNADSVLSAVNTADASSGEFNISNLIYYDIFGAFYLKCINVGGNDLCDNWQYKVNDTSPDAGMDSKILSGGENVVLYFGDENKIPPVETPPTHSSGGSYMRPLQTILPPPIDPLPLPSPVIPPEPTPASLNTNIEEKPKTVLPLTPKKQTKKISKSTKQNTASVINAVTPSPASVQTETPPPKKSWFRRLLDSIFESF